MSWDGIWRLTDPLMSGEQVRLMQDRALRHFGSYAVPLGVQRNGLYDKATAAWVAEYQKRKNDDGYKVHLPAHPTAKPGDCDYATKVALGIIAGSVILPPAQIPKAVAYAVPGTNGIWNDGCHWWTCERLGPDWYKQGIQYNTAAFLMPDPMHSYVEAVREGLAELLKFALPDPRPKCPIGWSMGAEVVARFLEVWPADRRDEIVAAVTFGSPARPPGLDENGSTSVNGGISRRFTPEWAQPIERSYHLDGDMYSDAPGLLPFIYEILTRMEMSGEFLFYMFGLLTGIPVGGGAGGMLGGLGGLGSLLGGGGNILGGGGGGLLPPINLGAGTQPSAPANPLGQALLGVAGSMVPGFGMLAPILGMITPGTVGQTGGPISLAAMLMNIPAIIQSLMALMKFMFTNAHFKYGGPDAPQIFGDTDAVIDAARAVNAIALPR